MQKHYFKEKIQKLKIFKNQIVIMILWFFMISMISHFLTFFINSQYFNRHWDQNSKAKVFRL